MKVMYFLNVDKKYIMSLSLYVLIQYQNVFRSFHCSIEHKDLWYVL